MTKNNMFPSLRLSGMCLFALLSTIQCANVNKDADAFEVLKRAARVKRVIGGRDIGEGKYPYLVHLMGNVPRKFFWGMPYSRVRYYCGGAVIDKRWVVTAAHCFRSSGIHANAMIAKYWHAKVGEVESQHDIFDRAKSFVGGVFGRGDWLLWNIHADNIFIHPDYSPENNWANDIAVIRLREELPVYSDNNIGMASLPDASDTTWPLDGTNCTFVGWGCDTNGGHIVDRGQEVVLPKVSDTECTRTYRVSLQDQSRFCAGHKLSPYDRSTREIGICAGDSGGPLICKKNDKWLLAGVASFTSADNPGRFPGVFTRVSKYVDWAIRKIRLYS